MAGVEVQILAFVPVGPEIRAVVAWDDGRMEHVRLAGLRLLPNLQEVQKVGRPPPPPARRPAGAGA